MSNQTTEWGEEFVKDDIKFVECDREGALYSVLQDLGIFQRPLSAHGVRNQQDSTFSLTGPPQSAHLKQPHCNLIQIFPEKEMRGLSPNFHIHVSVSD